MTREKVDERAFWQEADKVARTVFKQSRSAIQNKSQYSSENRSS